MRQPDITQARELLGWEPTGRAARGTARGRSRKPAPETAGRARRRARTPKAKVRYIPLLPASRVRDQESSPWLTGPRPRSGAGAGRAGPPPIVLPPQDVRRRRPPVLSFLLRMETLRRLARVVSLMALDFVGVFLAIFTALMVKEVVKHGDVGVRPVAGRRRSDYVAFAFLLTVLLFAKEGLYADRAAAPRPAEDRLLAVPGDGRGADLRADRDGPDAVLELLHLLRDVLLRDRLHRRSIRWGYEQVTGVLLRAAGYRRRAVLVGSGKHIEDVAHALRGRGQHPGRDARLHLAHAAAGQRPALARADRGPAARARRARRAGGHHRRPGLPAGPAASSSSTSATGAACTCASRRRRWRSSSSAPSSSRAATVPLFELRPPVFEGFDYVLKRVVRLVVAFGDPAAC